MQFNDWQSLFDEEVKFSPEEKDWTLHKRYDKESQRILAFPFKIPRVRSNRLLRLGSEYAWHQEGKPYYKVHPAIVGQLARINLDKIPARFIEIPNEYISVLIRFTDQIPTRYVEGGTLSFESVDRDNSPVGYRSVLFTKVKELLGKDTMQFIMHLDDGARMKQGDIECAACNTLHFSVVGDETIPECITRNIDEMIRLEDFMANVVISMRDRLEQLFRIIISIGFLANNPDNGVIIPDVLNRDVDAYHKAIAANDLERQKTILERAKRNHKLGWNVGTNEMFVPVSPLARSREHPEGTGRELSWSHIRGGHWHPVRFGHGKEKIMLKWFRSIRVRDDLPFKPE